MDRAIHARPKQAVASLRGVPGTRFGRRADCGLGRPTRRSGHVPLRWQPSINGKRRGTTQQHQRHEPPDRQGRGLPALPLGVPVPLYTNGGLYGCGHRRPPFFIPIRLLAFPLHHSPRRAGSFSAGSSSLAVATMARRRPTPNNGRNEEPSYA